MIESSKQVRLIYRLKNFSAQNFLLFNVAVA